MKHIIRRFICITMASLLSCILTFPVSAATPRANGLCAYCWTELQWNRTYQITETVHKSCENTQETGYVQKHYITYNCTEYVCTTPGCDFTYTSRTFVKELCQISNFKVRDIVS